MDGSWVVHFQNTVCTKMVTYIYVNSNDKINLHLNLDCRYIKNVHHNELIYIDFL